MRRGIAISWEQPPAKGDRITGDAFGKADNQKMVLLTTPLKVRNAECDGNFALERQFSRSPAQKK